MLPKDEKASGSPTSRHAGNVGTYAPNGERCDETRSVGAESVHESHYRPTTSLALIAAISTGVLVFVTTKVAAAEIGAWLRSQSEIQDITGSSGMVETILRYVSTVVIQLQIGFFVGLLVYMPLSSISSRQNVARLQQRANGATFSERKADFMRLECSEEARIAVMGYVVWLLPLSGFIGTVIGVSEAIGPLQSLSEPGATKTAAPKILGGLRYAFDTTLSGLALSAPAMAIATVARARSRDRLAALSQTMVATVPETGAAELDS